MSEFENGFAARGVVLLVKATVEKLWRKHRQSNPKAPEACGILMATIDSDSSRIWLEKATVPTKSDQRTRFSFRLKGKDHGKELLKQARSSGGTIRLLGTWHTHPEDDPTPSQADIEGWMKIRFMNPQFKEFCFIIVGLKTTAVYLSVGQKLTRMKPIKLELNSDK
jgi:integrative and conjugative element protein (TIGR02256 family)